MPDRPPNPYFAAAGLCFWGVVVAGVLSQLEISPWWAALVVAALVGSYGTLSFFTAKLELAAGSMYLKRVESERLSAALERGRRGEIPRRGMGDEEIEDIKRWADRQKAQAEVDEPDPVAGFAAVGEDARSGEGA